MAYTLTQARPLLTTAELELFSQSRTEPVKRLTPTDLAGAIKRTRTLRDKARDLYRRQTVSVRTDTPGATTGQDNARTQRKADILQEVLERYEARATLLQKRGSSKIGSAAKGRAANGKATAAAEKSTGAKAGALKKSQADAAPPSAGSAKAQPASSATPAPQAGSAPARSSKAPSRSAPTAQGKAHAPGIKAPLDTVPAAERVSPLKKDPGNIAIHAHQSASGRRSQGKRDSR